jgi:hypothetical protein
MDLNTADRQFAAQFAAATGDLGPVYAPGDLTPEDLAEIDAAYHQKKVSGGLRARDDRAACSLDQQHFDALRARGVL